MLFDDASMSPSEQDSVETSAKSRFVALSRVKTIISITINAMTRSHKCKSSFSFSFLPKCFCKSRT